MPPTLRPRTRQFYKSKNSTLLAPKITHTTRKKKAPPKTPLLDSLDIKEKGNDLSCSILCMRRRYCDDAIDNLKSRMAEKLALCKVKRIHRLRIFTPGHHSDLFDFFRSLSVQINELHVETTINSLDKDDWIDKALSFEKLDTIFLGFSDMKLERNGLVKSIIERCITLRKANIELHDQDCMFGYNSPYIDAKELITDEYLLKISKTMKQEAELDISSTLLSVRGILAVSGVISARMDAARIRFQIESDASAIKAEILKLLGLNEVVDREFREENQPNTTPLVYKQYTMYNQGCELLCIFDGRILLKMPTDYVLEGRLWNKRIWPHRFTIERVIDKKTQLALDRGFFEMKHK